MPVQSLVREVNAFELVPAYWVWNLRRKASELLERCHKNSFLHVKGRANGWRYPLVGGTREHHFAGTSFKPRRLPENAPTPTSRVHAVLATVLLCKNLLTHELYNIRIF